MMKKRVYFVTVVSTVDTEVMIMDGGDDGMAMVVPIPAVINFTPTTITARSPAK